ncbi:NAD(P)H dehydrogenase (quinone) [Acetoanaerobium pronyense]|uniref:NAD(P)H dehydrogenase (quinone) n=1 Tax=Acetoanaerobium pronyense TaxID=1482736 RepID=A0ABS4KHK1_9FIRM|nr:NAD(P)H:quinone oxidoreductase [Acetoanaerobium pronyense]MBP2027258.1 NAD(P)H dehydrogenase (quinone) [Acetoanaerobium pronyense]
MKVLIVYYSHYGHIHTMADAIAEGVREVEGMEPVIRRVPQTLNEDVLEKMGALDYYNKTKDIPIVTHDEMKEASAIVFGTPTRYGNMASQMASFIDTTGGLWAEGALVGKVGSVFTSTGTQHGGQESTILSFHKTLLHHGMVIAGLPYAFAGQSRIDEITGASPYGASTVAGPDGSRMPSENELDGARWQGRYVAQLAKKLGVK